MEYTGCLAESRYRMERALNTRGLRFDSDGRMYHVENTNGRFSLSFMPGNRRTLISHGVHIYQDKRGKGFGRKMLNLREEIAREIGVNLFLATVKNENTVEIHLLETSGWKRFTNRATTQTSLWGKELE